MLMRQRVAAQLIDEGLSCAAKAGRPDSTLLLQELMKQHEVLLNANAATELTPPQDKTTRSLASFCEVIRAQGVQSRKGGHGPPDRLYKDAMRAQAGLNLLLVRRALGPPAPAPSPPGPGIQRRLKIQGAPQNVASLPRGYQNSMAAVMRESRMLEEQRAEREV